MRSIIIILIFLISFNAEAENQIKEREYDSFFIFYSYKVMADKSEKDIQLKIKFNSTDSILLEGFKGQRIGTRFYNGVRIIIPSGSSVVVNVIPQITHNNQVYPFKCDTLITFNNKQESMKYIIYKKTGFGKKYNSWIVNLRKVENCKLFLLTEKSVKKRKLEKISNDNQFLLGEYHFDSNRFVYYKKQAATHR